MVMQCLYNAHMIIQCSYDYKILIWLYNAHIIIQSWSDLFIITLNKNSINKLLKKKKMINLFKRSLLYLINFFLYFDRLNFLFDFRKITKIVFRTYLLKNLSFNHISSKFIIFKQILFIEILLLSPSAMKMPEEKIPVFVKKLFLMLRVLDFF